MDFEKGPLFWRVVGAACLVVISSLAFPAFAGEAICAVVVLVAVTIMVRKRRGSSTSVRLLTIGCVSLGVAPVVTEVHRALGGGELFSAGDAVAMVGYLFAIAAAHRLVKVRTVDRQPHVMLDALAITGWLALAIGFASVEDILDQFQGAEQLVALAYLPFTLVLMFTATRLALGAGDRSGAFLLLAAATVSAAMSEISYLEAAVGADAPRRVGAVAATLALTFFAAAFVHPSADGLETPHPPTLSRTSQVLAAVIGSSTVALVFIAFAVDLRAFEAAILLFLGLLTAARAVFIVRERDEWVGLQRIVSDAAASIADLENADAIIEEARSSAESLITKKTMMFIEVSGEEAIADTLFEETDPAGVMINEIDGDLWRALDTGRTQRSEYLSGGTKGYSSRLVIPIEAGHGERHVMLIETTPVLSMTEIFHLELLAAGLGGTLAATATRRIGVLEKADRRFRSLVQDSNDIVMLVDESTLEAKLVSPTVERLLGYSEAECLGAHPLQFVIVEDGAHLLMSLESELATGTANDLRFVHKNGQIRWFAATVRRLEDDDELDGLIVSLSDIHDRKMAELQLGTSERRYRGLIETSRDVFCVVDDNLVLTFVSPNVEHVLQVPAATIIGSNVVDIVALESREDASALVDLSRDGADGRSVELQLLGGLGAPRWFEVSITDGSHTGNDGWVITARDIHAQHDMRESMQKATLHDGLTGLYNRASFQFEVNKSLQRMSAGQSVGVIHLDVRDFKVVNESLGFDAGDELLVAIGSRIRSGLRGSDVLARFGADSFAVLSRVDSVTELQDLANRINRMFTEPFETGSKQWSVTLSIGMSSTTSRRDAPVTLLEQAAIAVRHAKTSDKLEPVVFEAFMREVANERFEIESDLLPGLAAGEFSVVFQPLLLLSTQQVRSVEALLRWNHPDRGLVSPGRFIPVAERSGAIVELGRWVLAESCRQLKQWHDELPNAEALGVGVNISVRQLVKEGEFGRLTKIILDSGVNPERLTLELTESLVINEVPTVRRGIEALRSLGIRIAVDDFGTGTAGLNHLRDVPFDILKIDKSYVDPLAANHDSYQLLASVVELAHSMDATVVAEGIETHEQAALLRRMGCDVGQGFYLGRPMDPVSLEEWFASGRDGTVASQIEAPVTDGEANV